MGRCVSRRQMPQSSKLEMLLKVKSRMCIRQKEEARQAQEAAKRQQEALGERSRRAAYSGALRREADRIAAILAKQVRGQLLTLGN